MKNKFKNILNIFIAITFLTQSIYADILDDAMSQMSSDILTVGSYTSGTGETNYYSGSMSVRFNDVLPPGPIFSFTPPSIEIGCNGIDIKGMFLSLLGLDQLKDMLFNAGATLAWGVAIGLIYTLPGVANAFKWINAWAKKIQALLADACNAGQIIGNYLGKEAGLDSEKMQATVNKFISEISPGDYSTAKQKGESALLEAFGWYDGETPELSDNLKENAVVSLLRGIFESDASMMGGIMNSLATEMGGSTLKSILGGQENGAVKETNIALDSSLVESLGNAVPSGLSGVSKAKMSLFSYVLIYNFVGDLAITPPKNGTLDNLYNATDKSKEGATQFKIIESKDGRKLSTVHGMGGNASTKAKGEALGKFIWYGTPSSSPSQPTADSVVAINKIKNAKLVAPEITIYTLKDDEAEGRVSFIPVLKKERNTRNGKNYYQGGTNYNGTIMNARCIVDELVQGSGVYTDEKQSIITKNSCNTEFVFPELHKYVKIIKNSPNIEQYKLKFLLTKVTSIKMANAMLGAIGESLGHIRTSSGSSIAANGNGSSTGGISKTSKSNINAVLAYKKDVSEVMYAAGDFLEEKLAGEASIQSKVDSVFDIQARKNRERGLKSLQK